MDIQKTINSLNKNGYTVHYFEHESEAVDYLCAKYQNKVIGFGDSQTILQMKLYDALSEKNTVFNYAQSLCFNIILIQFQEEHLGQNSYIHYKARAGRNAAS